MTLVVLNATRGPIMGMRGQCIKGKKCLTKVLNLVLPFVCPKEETGPCLELRRGPVFFLPGVPVAEKEVQAMLEQALGHVLQPTADRIAQESPP